MTLLRLNVGCGDDRRDGYVNVDLREDVADVAASVDRLPWADRTVDEILALDILEHFPVFHVPAVLGEWRRVLRVGGVLMVRVPNLLALAEHIIANRSVEAVIRNIYGGHRWGVDGSLDAHHTGWTPDLLNRDLLRAGFDPEENDMGLNMTVCAVRA